MIKVGKHEPRDVSPLNHELFTRARKMFQERVGWSGIGDFIDWLEENYDIKAKALTEEESRQRESQVDCHVINAYCDHFTYQLDNNGEVDVSHCKNPNNIRNIEGNCTKGLCPRYGVVK